MRVESKEGGTSRNEVETVSKTSGSPRRAAQKKVTYKVIRKAATGRAREEHAKKLKEFMDAAHAETKRLGLTDRQIERMVDRAVREARREQASRGR